MTSREFPRASPMHGWIMVSCTHRYDDGMGFPGFMELTYLEFLHAIFVGHVQSIMRKFTRKRGTAKSYLCEYLEQFFLQPEKRGRQKQQKTTSRRRKQSTRFTILVKGYESTCGIEKRIPLMIEINGRVPVTHVRWGLSRLKRLPCWPPIQRQQCEITRFHVLLFTLRTLASPVIPKHSVFFPTSSAPH